MSPANKIRLLTAYMFTYLFVGIAFLGSLVAFIIPKLSGGKPISYSEVSLAFWIGIAVAITATQKGKSVWLWFLTGFLGIGFCAIFVLSIIMSFIKSFV